MTSKSLQLASIFLILADLLASGMAQPFCFNNGNYTSNSTYKINLDTLLSSLSTNVDSSGFYNASVGRNPDTAYAYVLCRGDVQPTSCSDCIRMAASESVKTCPYQNQVLSLGEFCTLRYSDEDLFGTMETMPTVFAWNIGNASSPNVFMSDVRTLLDNLRSAAASGGSVRKVAAGNMTSVDSQTIFSLVQCTPDLSPESCNACLRESADVPSQCNNKKGCRVMKPSCSIRYEVSSFYNVTRLQEIQALVTPRQPPSSSLPPTPPPPPPPPPEATPGTKGDNKTRTIIIVVVAIVVCVCLIVAVLAGVLLKKRSKKKLTEALESAPDINAAESLQHDFHEIKAATRDFSKANILGQGGFGAVYKGKLSNGQEVAVKRLSVESGQGDMEFKNEVLLLAKLQHRNLVRLLGFSMEGKERLLIYEFIENKSLDMFIFDPVKRGYLNWEMRYKIIGGIARGLLYLHEESRFKIIHRDLKASNILLDGDMNPKIADFGMARLCVTDETQGSTNRIVGTYGYMSPEYAIRGHFSVKSDVFSFGVLILEIITGQKNSSFRNGENIEDLLSMTWKYWRQGGVENIIDPVLRASLGSLRDMLRCIHIGLLCVQDNLTDRPTMASLVLMLSTSTISLPVPLEPVFFATSGYSSKIAIFPEYDSKELESTESLSQTKSDHSIESSKNDLSMTEFHPR
ncbi:Cysteine-rich RLK 29 [Dorcoceras hygrometricum]|uniref:Cysteine-rich RLK 29 n=1 Tax=Dorcoceras hygrometricum TaxID=472368 RepID=A0A2Z7CKE1_9LAMI|nr:Cysteine-rich RLK 29 [Dorcoceras hygrometricum]